VARKSPAALRRHGCSPAEPAGTVSPRGVVARLGTVSPRGAGSRRATTAPGEPGRSADGAAAVGPALGPASGPGWSGGGAKLSSVRAARGPGGPARDADGSSNGRATNRSTSRRLRRVTTPSVMPARGWRKAGRPAGTARAGRSRLVRPCGVSTSAATPSAACCGLALAALPPRSASPIRQGPCRRDLRTPPPACQRRSRRTRVWSRPGPTPIAEIGAPDISSRART